MQIGKQVFQDCRSVSSCCIIVDGAENKVQKVIALSLTESELIGIVAWRE